MKKLVLGVVALGVMVNVAWACQFEREQYAMCLENINPLNEQYCRVKSSLSNTITDERISRVKAKLEACLIRKGRY